MRWRALVNHPPHQRDHLEHFIDTKASNEATIIALLASCTLTKYPTNPITQEHIYQFLLTRVILDRATLTDAAGQPLNDNTIDRAAEQIQLNPHIKQPHHR